MPASHIRFFFEGVEDTLRKKQVYRAWIRAVFQSEGKNLGELGFIFCTDDFLSGINRQYLGHDTLTDVISFNLSEDTGKGISGEVYISLERVKENAATFGVAYEHELRRVMVHGVLHLIGYDDLSPGQRLGMKEKEDYYLSLPPSGQ